VFAALITSCICPVQQHFSTDVHLALTAHPAGPRPAASIALWVRLLPVWERYRRWLDLVAARCGLLGARVAAARQLAEPGLSAGRSTAGLLPHLRNKGLLLFRGHVLLAYGLRRPLQVRQLRCVGGGFASFPGPNGPSRC
jgi:hypothetical protein